MSAKPTKAQRAAQSARDKALAKQIQGMIPKSRKVRITRRNGENPTEGVASAYSQLQGSEKPYFTTSTSKSGDLRVNVRFRELVKDVPCNTVYACQGLPINPGLSSTFPWLSQLANLFESYQFRKLSFEFRTMVGSVATGKALLSVDWDAADALPTTKAEQMQNRTKADDAVWKNINLQTDGQDLGKFGTQRFTRSGALAANLDIKTYDVGNFIYGSVGGDDSTSGELYVCYDVDLMTPQPATTPVADSPAASVTGVAMSKTNLFGNAPVVQQSVGLLSASQNTLTFNLAGQYLVEVERTGTTLIALVASGAAYASTRKSIIDGAATHAVDIFQCNVAAPGETLVFDATGDATDTASLARVMVYPVAFS